MRDISKIFLVYIFGAIILVASVSCANVASTPIVTPVPTLPVWEKEFPLAMSDTWIYHAMRYDGFNPDDLMTVARVITETVVEIRNTPPYYAAKIREDLSAEVPVYVPPSMRDMMPNAAASNEYWLVVEGTRIYRQEKLDLAHLSETGTVQFVFPLHMGDSWYQTDEMTKLYPEKKNASMLRRVTRVETINTPAGYFGSFSNCYLIEEGVGGSTLENWFCPGVGWVNLKDDHHGTPLGSQRILIKYQVR